MKKTFFEELLRERCIFDSLPGKFKKLWFNYMLAFLEQCFDPETQYSKFTSECSAKILLTLEIDNVKINECINNSFATPGNFSSDNVLLARDQADEFSNRIRATPQVSIGQGFLYRGEFRAYDLKQAVCSAFRRQPPECR